MFLEFGFWPIFLVFGDYRRRMPCKTYIIMLGPQLVYCGLIDTLLAIIERFFMEIWLSKNLMDIHVVYRMTYVFIYFKPVRALAMDRQIWCQKWLRDQSVPNVITANKQASPSAGCGAAREKDSRTRKQLQDSSRSRLLCWPTSDNKFDDDASSSSWDR